MTAIASSFSPEGFVIGSDGLRTDENGNVVTLSAQKIWPGTHRDFRFAVGWAGASSFNLPSGRRFSFPDELNAAMSQIEDVTFSGAMMYVHKLAVMVATSLLSSLEPVSSESSGMLARAVFVGYYKGNPARLEVWFNHDNGWLVAPEIRIMDTDLSAFAIFSGSAGVFESMGLKRAPKSLLEAALYVSTYLQRCVDGRESSEDCKSFGGRVQLAQVSEDGFLWLDSSEEPDIRQSAILRSLIQSPPISKAEISAKIKAERAAKKAARQRSLSSKWTIPRPRREPRATGLTLSNDS